VTAPARLGRAVLLVANYDEAIAFWRDALGWEPLVDMPGPHGLRFVHVGNPKQDDVGLWLLEPGSDDQRSRVGNQTGGAPAFVVYTDDLHAAHERLRQRGVTVRTEPKGDDTSRWLHFLDPYGNDVVLVELLGS
jgi:catechol 2,3-dioxygenase-like lactoylglutathione lyase family enzyme